MASIYYLLDDALHIAEDIVEGYNHQYEDLQGNHHAATIIQRTYRTYKARKNYKKNIQAAIVLQKYARGWLVRYHLPDILQEFWDGVCKKVYNIAATQIQAVWKGKLVRNEIDIKKILATKRNKISSKTREFPGNNDNSMDIFQDPNKKNRKTDLEKLTNNGDDDIPYGGEPQCEEMILRRKILEMMFDRHHLLSTEIHKSVLNSNMELKEIEKVLKSLQWTDYMKQRRKIYEKYVKLEENEKQPYSFKNKKLIQQENLLRLRDIRHDVKNEYLGDFIADYRKPFNLIYKPEDVKYERNFMNEGNYVKRISNITRTEDKTRNISKEDFILTLKKITKESKVLPYYADFWYKECSGHNFLE